MNEPLTEFFKDSFIEEEVLDWYRMSQAERFTESQKLWEVFVLLKGSYDPEPDSQSHFYSSEAGEKE